MSRQDDIAIVGLGCRFPGANSPEAFGDLLRRGGSAHAPIPEARWRLFAGNDGVETGLANPRAGLVDDIDGLDRRCFRISANEAPMVDPLQRLFLEASWHALESAGLSPARLDGANIGVFAGVSQSEYALLQAEAGFPGVGNPYQNTGSSASVVAGRVAYSLGLTGPVLAIDNACASSLSAVIAACESLVLGRCDMALAGGAHVILSKKIMKSLAVIGVLSDDGNHRCFDRDANGFVRGEGCGVIALKRVEAARADGDRIHAVIRGWYQRHNGRTNGLAAPSGEAQTASMSGAMEQAEVDPGRLGYVEAHGSGTSLGDLMEAEAIQMACASRSDTPIMVGSVKATLGHLEAAAGIAGLIKTTLMLRDGYVPAQPGFRTLSDAVSRTAPKILVPTTLCDWDDPARDALVSALGFNGGCVHAVMSNAPDTSNGSAGLEPAAQSPGLFLLSAACPAALAERLAQLGTVLETVSEAVSVAHIAQAVSARWGGLAYRASFYAHARQDALTQLRNWRAQNDPAACRARLAARVTLAPDPEAWGRISDAVPTPWKADRIAEVFKNLGITLTDQPGDLVVRVGAQPVQAGEVCIDLTDDPTRAIFEAVGQIWSRGVPIDRAKLWPQTACNPACDLPGYPFQRDPFWAIPQSGGVAKDVTDV